MFGLAIADLVWQENLYKKIVIYILLKEKTTVSPPPPLCSYYLKLWYIPPPPSPSPTMELTQICHFTRREGGGQEVGALRDPSGLGRSGLFGSMQAEQIGTVE